jgi:hypothetical protein
MERFLGELLTGRAYAPRLKQAPLTEEALRFCRYYVARSILVAMLAVSMVNAPCFSASDKPLGMIVMAQSSLLGNLEAVAGANVYSGDTLSTHPDGLIRMKMGQNQFFLSGNTVATFSPADNGLHARLQTGTAGFSAIGQQVEIETPVGIVRPSDGQRTFAQVTVTGPNEMVVSAHEGSLVVDGSDHTITAGQSYKVTLVADNSSPFPQQAQGAGTGKNNKIISPYRQSKKKLVFDLILLGGAIGGGFFVYHEFSESCSDPGC